MENKIILVLGGYGNFGKRICAALMQQPGVLVLIAGRNLQKAEQLCNTLKLLHVAALVQPIALDIFSNDFAQQLKTLNPFLAIHTGGPFQGQDYRVPQEFTKIYFAKVPTYYMCIVVVGTGAGIVFFMLMASRTKNITAIAATARMVVLADWIFTAPAVVGQFVTGVLLMQMLHYSFSAAWFLVVISLFLFIGCCWMPVVFIQYKLKAFATEAEGYGVLDQRFSAG